MDSDRNSLLHIIRLSLVLSDWNRLTLGIEQAVRSLVRTPQEDQRALLGLVIHIAGSLHLIQPIAIQRRVLLAVSALAASVLESLPSMRARSEVASVFESVTISMMHLCDKSPLVSPDMIYDWDSARFIFRLASLLPETPLSAPLALASRIVSDLLNNSPQYLVSAIYFRLVFPDIVKILLALRIPSLLMDLLEKKTLPPFAVTDAVLVDNCLFVRNTLLNHSALLGDFRICDTLFRTDALKLLYVCARTVDLSGESTLDALNSLASVQDASAKAAIVSLLNGRDLSSVSPDILSLLSDCFDAWARMPLVQPRRAFTEVVIRIMLKFIESEHESLTRSVLERYAAERNPEMFLDIIHGVFSVSSNPSPRVIATLLRLPLVSLLANKSDEYVQNILKILRKAASKDIPVVNRMIFADSDLSKFTAGSDKALLQTVFEFQLNDDIFKRNQEIVIRRILDHQPLSAVVDMWISAGFLSGKTEVQRLVLLVMNRFNEKRFANRILVTVLEKKVLDPAELMTVVAQSGSAVWWTAAINKNSAVQRWIEETCGTRSIERFVSDNSEIMKLLSFSQRRDVVRSFIALKQISSKL